MKFRKAVLALMTFYRTFHFRDGLFRRNLVEVSGFQMLRFRKFEIFLWRDKYSQSSLAAKLKSFNLGRYALEMLCKFVKSQEQRKKVSKY